MAQRAMSSSVQPSPPSFFPSSARATRMMPALSALVSSPHTSHSIYFISLVVIVSHLKKGLEEQLANAHFMLCYAVLFIQ